MLFISCVIFRQPKIHPIIEADTSFLQEGWGNSEVDHVIHCVDDKIENSFELAMWFIMYATELKNRWRLHRR